MPVVTAKVKVPSPALSSVADRDINGLRIAHVLAKVAVNASVAVADSASLTNTLRLKAAGVAVWDDIAGTVRNTVRHGIGDSAVAAVALSSGVHRLPNVVQAGGSIVSALIPCAGLLHIAAGVYSTQNGAIAIQRYFDMGGLITVSTAISASITANGSAVAEATDSKACSAFKVTITNTGTADATLTGLTVLLLTK